MADADKPKEQPKDTGGAAKAAGPAGAVTAATKEITAALDRLAKAWPGADAAPDTPPDPAPALADRARKKYDATIRWTVATFTAIGTLIFGSLPFVDLTDANPLLFGPGLLVAALGLGTIIWATTTALEPEDASLGELATTLQGVPRGHWWAALRGARMRSAWDLKQVLTGAGGEAHLGPGIGSVQELIQRLGQLNSAVLQDDVGWNGGSKSTDGDTNRCLGTPPPCDCTWLESGVAQKAQEEAARAEMAAIAKTLEELRKQLPPAGKDKAGKAETTAPGGTDETTCQGSTKQSPSPGWAQRLCWKVFPDKGKPTARTVPNRDARIEKLEERYRVLIGLLPDEDTLKDRGAAAARRAALERYVQRRHDVLQMSLVSQMRGTFRQARDWLVVGAFLTLAGGALYAYAVANPQQGLVGREGVATIGRDVAVEELDSCLELPSGLPRDYVVLRGIITDDSDGRFTLVVTEGGCVGASLEFAQEGNYFNPTTTATGPAASGSDD